MFVIRAIKVRGMETYLKNKFFEPISSLPPETNDWRIKNTTVHIFILISTETGCLSSLERKFLGSTHPAKEFTQENSITESFQGLGVSFKTVVIPSECDITSCFESDSRDGKLLLHFLLYRVGCRDDGPPELLEMIKEFLKTEGISYIRNGRIYAAAPTHVIVASTS